MCLFSTGSVPQEAPNVGGFAATGTAPHYCMDSMDLLATAAVAATEEEFGNRQENGEFIVCWQ